MRTACRAVFVSTLVLLGPVAAMAQQATGAPAAEKAGTASSVPAIDPAAIAALRRMGDFLRKHDRLQVKGVTNTDELLESGQAVQLNARVDVMVRKPNRLRVSKVSDRKTREFYFDGKTFTIFGPKAGYYAQVPAPPTIQQVIEVAGQRYGVELPLADLFYWGTDKSGLADIKAAVNVGPSTVEGALCDHFAFRQRDVDWQVWIQQGDQPLPRKLVVTSVNEPARPQHQAVMTWTLNPALDDKLFVFVPPKGALPIAIDDAEQLARPARQGRAAPRTGGDKP
jgi:hypothetical protein